MRILIGLAGATLLGACFDVAPYACDGDAQCQRGAFAGTCEGIGYCSYPDTTCEDGRRWGPHAGDGLADRCLDIDAATGSGSTTAPPTATTLDSDAMTSGSSGDSTSAGECPDWPDDVGARRPLDYGGFGPVANFPLLLVLTPDRIDYDATRPDGTDVRLFDEGGNELPHEIARWVPGGTSLLWVQLATATQDGGRLWMYWDGPSVHTFSDGEPVWAEHRGAYHFEQSFDAAANAGVSVSAVAVDFGASPVGDAIVMTTDSRASIDSGLEDTLGVGTLSAWVSFDNVADGGNAVIAARGDSPPGDGGFAIELSRIVDTGAIEFSRDFTGGPSLWETPGGAVTAQTWHHLAVVVGGDPFDATIYVDGVSAGATVFDPPFGATVDDPAATVVRLFGNESGTAALEGALDELRITDLPRTQAWISAEYRAGRDELVTYGAAQTCP